MAGSPTPDVARLMVALGDALGHALRPASLSAELQTSVAQIRSLYSAAACSCARVEPDGESLRFVAADGVGAAAIVGVVLPIGRGIAGWVAMSGQPLVTNLAQDTRFARDVAEATDYVPETLMAAPLVGEDGEVVGVLEVLDPRSAASHAGHDLDTLGVLAAQVASIIRLCEVYDALGATLLGGLARSSNSEDFSAALAAVVDAGDTREDLVALAEAFHSLATTGPEGTRLATRMLSDVAAFTRTRR